MSDAGSSNDVSNLVVTPNIEIDDDAGEIGGDGDACQKVVPYSPQNGPETAEGKKPGNHQHFLDMAVKAIKSLRGRSSLKNIKEYIFANFDFGRKKRFGKFLSKLLRKGVATGLLRRSKKGRFFLNQTKKQTSQAQSKNSQETNVYKAFGEYVGVALEQLPSEIADKMITEMQNLIQRAQTGTTEKD